METEIDWIEGSIGLKRTEKKKIIRGIENAIEEIISKGQIVTDIQIIIKVKPYSVPIINSKRKAKEKREKDL